MMNGPADKMKKAAKVLDRVIHVPKTLFFRESYNMMPSLKNQQVEYISTFCKG